MSLRHLEVHLSRHTVFDEVAQRSVPLLERYQARAKTRKQLFTKNRCEVFFKGIAKRSLCRLNQVNEDDIGTDSITEQQSRAELREKAKTFFCLLIRDEYGRKCFKRSYRNVASRSASAQRIASGRKRR